MKIEKIESYPPLTIDEQETVLTWDAEERDYYDEVKLAKKGDKIKMTSDITSNVINGCCPFTYGEVCEIIEAIVKGGYND